MKDNPLLNCLLVEDNDRLRQALTSGLEASGAVVVVGGCASGEEALTACMQSRPQVILMDVHLAGAMNGIQAATAIRQVSREARSPPGSANGVKEATRWYCNKSEIRNSPPQAVPSSP